MKTLEEFIRENVARGVIDFDMRATVVDDVVSFYIHPEATSGDTLDFRVVGNTCLEGPWTKEMVDPR